MSTREQVVETVRQRRFDELEAIVSKDRRTVRILVGMTYDADRELRGAAARGLALAARHHPVLVGEVVRRLVWAMNDESGTNALYAPETLRAIAEERPEMLVDVLPDLMRLSADPGLHEALVEVARLVGTRCPQQAGQRMQEGLRHCGQGGERGDRRA